MIQMHEGPHVGYLYVTEDTVNGYSAGVIARIRDEVGAGGQEPGATTALHDLLNLSPLGEVAANTLIERDEFMLAVTYGEPKSDVDDMPDYIAHMIGSDANGAMSLYGNVVVNLIPTSEWAKTLVKDPHFYKRLGLTVLHEYDPSVDDDDEWFTGPPVNDSTLVTIHAAGTIDDQPQTFGYRRDAAAVVGHKLADGLQEEILEIIEDWHHTKAKSARR